MPRWLVVDELHVQVSVPQYDARSLKAVRKLLAGRQFLGRLRTAVRDAISGTPTPNCVRVRVQVSR
jgi:hypothetical protein